MVYFLRLPNAIISYINHNSGIRCHLLRFDGATCSHTSIRCVLFHLENCNNLVRDLFQADCGLQTYDRLGYFAVCRLSKSKVLAEEFPLPLCFESNKIL